MMAWYIMSCDRGLARSLCLKNSLPALDSKTYVEQNNAESLWTADLGVAKLSIGERAKPQHPRDMSDNPHKPVQCFRPFPRPTAGVKPTLDSFKRSLKVDIAFKACQVASGSSTAVKLAENSFHQQD